MATPTQRRAIGQAAAHTRWAREADRTAATAPARRGLEAKWAAEIDPTGLMPADELEQRIESMRQAHMARMRLARSQRAEARRGRAA